MDKSDRLAVIVDDGGDMTLLVHEGYQAEERYAKDGTLPDPDSTDSAEFKARHIRTHLTGLVKNNFQKRRRPRVNPWLEVRDRLHL